MKRKVLFLVCLLVVFNLKLIANADDTISATHTIKPQLRISLVTCGPGAEEVYEVFGHTAVRVIDSLAKTDIVYNYGTFDGFDKDFEWKFMRGKLAYRLAVEDYRGFEQQYVMYRRSVSEQELLLTDPEKLELVRYLEWNAEPENREYKYDFFFDNCATRIRDVFPKIIPGFQYATILPPGKITYRDIINKYFIPTPWERFGVNILLGSKIDKVMSNDEIMFLPDYLNAGLKGASAGTRKITGPEILLVPSGQALIKKDQGPFLLTTSLAIITIITLTIKPLRKIGRAIRALIVLTTGLLGCLILVMWFGTDHQACQNNFNLLWALPTNILIAFTHPKGKPRYVVVAIFLIFIALLLHFLRIQQMLFPEMLPLLMTMIVVYGSIFMETRKKNRAYAKN